MREVVEGVIDGRITVGGFGAEPNVIVFGGIGRCWNVRPEGPFGAVGGGAFFFKSITGLGGSGRVTSLRSVATACSTIFLITNPSRSTATRIAFKPILSPFLPSMYAFLAAEMAETGGPPRNDLESLYRMPHIAKNLPVAGSVLLLTSAISP